MDDLLIEGIDDDLLQHLEQSARQNDRTIEAEVIARLLHGLEIENAELRGKQAAPVAKPKT